MNTFVDLPVHAPFLLGFALTVLFIFGWLVVWVCCFDFFFVKERSEVPGLLEIAGMPLRNVTE